MIGTLTINKKFLGKKKLKKSHSVAYTAGEVGKAKQHNNTRGRVTL
jgi:hypothetical protein